KQFARILSHVRRHRNLCDRDEEAQDFLPAGPGSTMGVGHKAKLARRWPAGRLSAPARATEGNAYGKGHGKQDKTDAKEFRNRLEAAGEGEGGITALRLMTIGDQSGAIFQVDLATNWQQHRPKLRTLVSRRPPVFFDHRSPKRRSFQPA